MKYSSLQQFACDFIEFYESRAHYPSVVVDVQLCKLYEKAQQCIADSTGASISRAIEHYQIKPKNRKRISKYL